MEQGAALLSTLSSAVGRVAVDSVLNEAAETLPLNKQRVFVRLAPDVSELRFTPTWETSQDDPSTGMPLARFD
jgi:hypothetical protein